MEGASFHRDPSSVIISPTNQVSIVVGSKPPFISVRARECVNRRSTKIIRGLLVLLFQVLILYPKWDLEHKSDFGNIIIQSGGFVSIYYPYQLSELSTRIYVGKQYLKSSQRVTLSLWEMFLKTPCFTDQTLRWWMISAVKIKTTR